MGEFVALSQSSILLPDFRVQGWCQRQLSLGHHQPSSVMPLSLHVLTKAKRSLLELRAQSPRICTHENIFKWGVHAGVVSDFKAASNFATDSAGVGHDVLPDSGGNGAGDVPNGGSNDNGGHGGNDDGSNEGESDYSKRKAGLSMSQKLTLGFAFLVGAGGVMGFLKSGSQKSLIAGGVSASLLYCVYTMLPTNPVLASSMGFVLSAGLLGVMGSRFMTSKKVFPAGIVSLVSLIMTGGYLHGIIRSVH
ncbi:unnamed protein product [Cuscuta europaea]|uniref:Uncharacterized protein n=1 Tax=Cuscuta europaea TaxID=41803 RepID=A0A9P1EL99_CUSEU|nr:unnamed protein product [Cuscuta europaea]